MRAVDVQIQTLISENRAHGLLFKKHASELKEDLTAIHQRIMKVQGTQPDRNLNEIGNIDEVTSDLLHLSLRTRRLAKEEKILDSVNFDQRPVRHSNITDAHEKTLSWLLNPQLRRPEGLPDDEGLAGTGNVLKWLKSGQGTFWVSGKPGSGKSTAMKFIADHATTKNALSKWASPNDLVVGCHYFWSTGIPEQKSLQGMLRSLIYDFMSQAPQIIATICPDRWALEDTQLGSKTWTIKELYACLGLLAREPNLGVKFCAFIDGPDEYAGDHLEMAQTLAQLSQSPNLKICLSSRPWNVFEEIFGCDPQLKIYIHEWTRVDIMKFSRSRLTVHPRWRATVGETEGDAFIEKITTRAEGVFLWVFLVTKLLRDGLTNYDTINDLNNILDEMPSDLERFFMHMLSSVSPIYHKKMARILKVAAAAEGPLPFLIYHFLEAEHANPEYALQEPTAAFSDDLLADIKITVARHLNGRCMGLLELRWDQVQFIHRTVSDWLRMGKIDDFLVAEVGSGFEAHRSIAHAYLARMKRSHYKNDVRAVVRHRKFSWEDGVAEDLHELFERVNRGAVFSYADTAWVFPLVEEVSVTIQSLFDKRQARFSPGTSEERVCHNPMLMFRWVLLERDIWNYLGPKLEIMPHYFQDMPASPLSIMMHLCDPSRGTALRCLDRHTVIDLIGMGKPSLAPLIWTLICQECAPGDILNPERKIDVYQAASFASLLKSGVVRCLMEHHHGVNTRVHLSSGCSVSAWLAVFLFGIIFPSTSDTLCEWVRVMEEGGITQSVDLKCLAHEYTPGISILKQFCLFIDIFCDSQNGHDVNFAQKGNIIVAFLSTVKAASPDPSCLRDVQRLLDRVSLILRPKGSKRKRADYNNSMTKRRSGRRRA